MYIVLIVIFIIIFLATAVLTIFALPGWIKIPDNYLKILFSSLLLEVIACVFLVFNIVRPTTHRCEDGLSHKGNDWVILNDDGQIFQLSINDTLKLGMGVEEFSRKARSSNGAIYNLVRQDGNYFVVNSDARYIGRIDDRILKDSLKLFDEINLKNNIFERITYIRDNEQWKVKNEKILPKKWSLKIQLSNSGYTVSDTDPNYYEEYANSFDKFERKLHSFKGSDGAFYIVRITDADNSSEDKPHFVTFMILRTEIESKLN